MCGKRFKYGIRRASIFRGRVVAGRSGGCYLDAAGRELE